MPREKMADKKQRAQAIEARMLERYGEGECSLDYLTPFQLVCAVMLSAQTTDASVNRVTPELFARYGTPQDMAGAALEDVERIIHSLGFYHSKARHLIELSQVLIAEFDGEVPQDVDEMQKLPGVGRKTANVVMCEAFKKAQASPWTPTSFARPSPEVRRPFGRHARQDRSPPSEGLPESDWLYINHQWCISAATSAAPATRCAPTASSTTSAPRSASSEIRRAPAGRPLSRRGPTPLAPTRQC